MLHNQPLNLKAKMNTVATSTDNTSLIGRSVKLPAIDFFKCQNCRKCIEACLPKAIVKSENFSCSKCVKYCITMKVPCEPAKIFFRYELCDACGKCILACEDKAIYWFVPE